MSSCGTHRWPNREPQAVPSPMWVKDKDVLWSEANMLPSSCRTSWHRKPNPRGIKITENQKQSQKAIWLRDVGWWYLKLELQCLLQGSLAWGMWYSLASLTHPSKDCHWKLRVTKKWPQVGAKVFSQMGSDTCGCLLQPTLKGWGICVYMIWDSFKLTNCYRSISMTHFTSNHMVLFGGYMDK